jgi:hypothetical protein
MVSVLTEVALGADEPRPGESGLRPGEFANPFSVTAVTGPYRGKTLCYRCKLGDSPVVCIFARRITEPLTSLLKQLDRRIATEKADFESASRHPDERAQENGIDAGEPCQAKRA